MQKVSAVYAPPALDAEGTITNGPYFGPFPQKGDINGDGLEDVVFPGWGASIQTGKVYVYFGNGSGYSANANVTISAEMTSDNLGGYGFGNGLAIADLNNDGFDDMFISAAGNDENGSNAGKIYVFYGRSDLSGDLSAAAADISSLGNLTDRLRLAVSLAIVDMNNDGRNDLVFSAWTNVTSIFRIYTVLNVNNVFDLDNPSFTKVVNVAPATMFAWNGVGAVGDFNGDGNKDLMIGETPTTGIQHLFFGTGTGELIESVKVAPVLAADTVGIWGTISSADIDGDGKTDICIGAYQHSAVLLKRGRVYCFLGRANWNSTYSLAEANFIVNGQAAGDDFGRALYLYDLTNDGLPELLVGAYQYDAGAGARHGKLFIYKNNQGTFADTPWISLIKTSGNALFAGSILAADWDYDGWSNLFITQYGTLSAGTGDPVVNLYELAHGTPAVALGAVPGNTNSVTVSGTATEENLDYAISTVEWSTSNTTSGSWTMCIATDGTFDSSSEAFTCNYSALADGTGKRIYVRTRDQNEVYVPPNLYADTGTFVLDRSGPTGSVSINNGATSTASESVTLAIAATDALTSITHMKISDIEALTGAEWETYAANKAYTLPVGNGTKVVYIKFKDAAGNESATYSDTITLTYNPAPTPKTTEVYSSEETEEPTLPTPTPSTTDTVIALVTLVVTDQNGALLTETAVYIDGQKYVTDKNGKIYIEEKPTEDMVLEVEVNGKRIKGSVMGEKIVADALLNDPSQKSATIWLKVLFWFLVLSGVGYGVVKVAKSFER
jgi:hypothetical protein